MESIGPYTVEAEVARGGQGRVLRARDRHGSLVAIKVWSGGAGNEVARRRLLREARALGQLHHPHVVRVLDVGEERGEPYLVMSWVEGISLEERLQRGGPLPVEEALGIGRALASALAQAHARGLLHRDLKPANVLLRQADGAPVLLDFGLTRTLDPAAQSLALSASGAFLGTPGYWAPEQGRGDLAKVGPASDVYGLGAVLYAMLTGQPPQGRPANAAEAFLALSLPARPPGALRPDLPPALEAVVLRCLALEPAERYPDAGAALAALDRCGGRPGTRRRSRLAAAILLLGALSATGLVLLRPRATPRAGALDATRRRGAELAQRGDAHGALAAFEEVLASGESPEVRLQRAMVLCALGRWEEGAADCDRVLAARPDLPQAFTQRALARQVLGDPDGALSDARRANELAPQDGRTWMALATCLQNRGELSEALACYGRAAELLPADASVPLLCGALRLGMRDLEGALADAERAVALGPRLGRAWGLRGEVRVATGDLPGALQDLEQALALDPRPDIYLRRGNVLAAGGDLQGALEDYERALALAPDSVEAHFDRGNVLARLERLEDAIPAFERSVELRPGFVDGWGNLALTRGQLGDLAGALRDAERAMQLRPDSGTHYLRADLRLRAGDLPGALADYDAAVRLAPSDPDPYNGRALARERSGDRAGALADLRQVLRLAPADSDAARRARANLEALGGQPD